MTRISKRSKIHFQGSFRCCPMMIQRRCSRRWRWKRRRRLNWKVTFDHLLSLQLMHGFVLHLRYADRQDAYWTRYFTSRPAIKGYVKTISGYLLAARQLEFSKEGITGSPQLTI